MALWVLQNDCLMAHRSHGPTVLKAGKTIDDTLYILADIIAAGGVLQSQATNSTARGAQMLRRDLRGQHGGLVDERSVADAGGLPATSGGGASLSVVLVNAGGTGGAQASPYNANPGDTCLVDASAGPVTINLPTLALNGAVTVKQNANTSFATNAITVNAPAGVTLEQPAPNNAAGFVSAFVFGGATAVFTGDEARGMSITWFNGGSSGVYNLL